MFNWNKLLPRRPQTNAFHLPCDENVNVYVYSCIVRALTGFFSFFLTSNSEESSECYQCLSYVCWLRFLNFYGGSIPISVGARIWGATEINEPDNGDKIWEGGMQAFDICSGR